MEAVFFVRMRSFDVGADASQRFAGDETRAHATDGQTLSESDASMVVKENTIGLSLHIAISILASGA